MLKYKIPQIVTLILFSYIDLLNYMLKYKIPQIVTLIPTNSVTCYQLRQKTKKDRQEWKPPNSLNLLCSGTRD